VTVAETIASEDKKKPNEIFLIGVKLIPAFRNPGYMRKSMIGMTMMMKMGFKLLMTSLGTPPRVMVLAWETRFPVIWLYASQYRGYQRNTLQARRPRRTSSTQASSKVIQVGRSAGAMLLGLTLSQKSGCLKFLSLELVSQDPKE